MELVTTLIDALVTDYKIRGKIKPSTRADRFAACKALAVELAEKGNTRQALLPAKRAFELWKGEPGFIDTYLNWLSAEHDAEGIRKVSKRAGMRMADCGTLLEALRYFNLHHYAYQSTGGGDHYEYDFDILSRVERLAQLGSAHKRSVKKSMPEKGSPLRTAYLLYGATHTDSALVRLMADVARYHDRTVIDCCFFSPDINAPTTRQKSADLLSAAGADLIAVDSMDEKYCLSETKKKLLDWEPDILVSVAALGDFKQYYLFCACEAPVKIALCFGPPAQFVPPGADFVISSTVHPLIDCPCDGAVVNVEPTPPQSLALTGKGRLPNHTEIPDDAVVVMAAGRSEKFLDREYWQSIFNVIRSRENVHFVAIGITNAPIFLDELLTDEIKHRGHVFGWLNDYHDVLRRADILVDTYPSGGGLTIIDAMFYGIPVLSFTNDYSKVFDQRTWSLADETIGNPDLIVPRGNFFEFECRLGQLIDDACLRERLGQKCKRQITRTKCNPERMVRRIEKHYLTVAKQKFATDSLHN